MRSLTISDIQARPGIFMLLKLSLWDDMDSRQSVTSSFAGSSNHSSEKIRANLCVGKDIRTICNSRVRSKLYPDAGLGCFAAFIKLLMYSSVGI
jgi:hypothetical protein